MLFYLILLVLILVYIYVKVKYFSLRGNIPGQSPHIFFGNLIQTGMLFNGTTTAEVFPLFKQKFGNIFQFWLGFTRVIVVSDIDDVQHIFSNRHIYDLGDIHVEKLGSMFPDSLMGIKGHSIVEFETKYSLIMSRCDLQTSCGINTTDISTRKFSQSFGYYCRLC